MSINRQHSFWGHLSPLGGLTGAGLLIMSTSRLSWAITVSGCLFWVYGFTALTFTFLSYGISHKIFPKTGRKYLFIGIASFYGSLYILLIWLLSPFAAFEVFIQLLLVPLFCSLSGVQELLVSSTEKKHFDVLEYVSDAVSQAAVLSGLLIVFSILREPLSFCSLSFPGSYSGMITIMYFTEGPFFPIGIFGASCGALLILGFFICLYQYCKSVFFRGEIDE